MITVYSKENCSQCDQAKLILDMKGAEYEVKMLDTDFTIEDAKALGRTSFPIVTYGDTMIGGVLELRKFLK